MTSEKGAIHKDPGGKLAIALVYPNTYWVGMSNLGLHTLYRTLNRHPGIVCERFFTDHPRSVENQKSLSDFPIIAFSVSYELDWINVVRILMDNKIELKAAERTGAIVIAGGTAVTMNPEPACQILDVCFLGDGEGAADLLHQAFTASASRAEFFNRLEGQAGIYLPARFNPAEDGGETRPPRLSIMDPLTSPAHSAILTPDTAFGDMYLVETARGCPYHCKFCTARAIYAPFRPVPIEALLPVLDEAKASGLKLGLVSTSLNNHPQAAGLYAEIMARGLAIAPPSLRFGMITPELLEHIRLSKVKGVTLAPETGSVELRRAIGKPIPNETILDDIECLIASGIRDIKLYCMVGLPEETPDDIDASIDLIKRIRQGFIKVSRGNRIIGTLSVNINTFVPKPHSTFERAPMITVSEAKARIKRLAKGLAGTSNVSVSFEGPKWAYLQAVIARGDRNVFDLIHMLALNPENRWQEALRAWPRNPDYYALRQRNEDERLPWAFY